MLISVLGFGSIWSRRAADAQLSGRLNAAYYNTTGVLVGGTFRNRPRLYGVAQFNGNSGFRPDRTFNALSKVFECEPSCVWKGVPKVLFKMVLPRPAKPDAYLVTVTDEQSSRFNKDSRGTWMHADARLISFSECLGAARSDACNAAFRSDSRSTWHILSRTGWPEALEGATCSVGPCVNAMAIARPELI
jgi:hypothetical protein